MQREIKFKFWLGNINKMTYAHTLKEVGKIIPEFSDDIVALQFTGLKDKNGKEIYEGDIVFWNDRNLVVEYRTDIANRGCFRMVEDELTFTFSTAFHQVEVLGNIYETPSLLTHTNK